MKDQAYASCHAQASRCYGCGVPFCQTGSESDGKPFGCPLKNLIPEWNAMLAGGNVEEAVRRLLKTNCFPEITGRVCPAFCQQVCIHRETDKKPVQNRATELFLAEYAFANGMITAERPALRSGNALAIIGSGPMGLAAAHYLSARGHDVTVYEKEAAPGGGLLTKISRKKLPESVINRRLSLLEAQGVQFITNETVDAEALQGRYDLVVDCAAEKANPFIASALAAGKQAAVDAECALLGYTNLL
ncbi:MAG: FAD-dependent oxidoreductase [Peptococcaceae bacterium]|nr:FAD-dependent oxidoreductase [Peptococcaceae bacterium]